MTYHSKTTLTVDLPDGVTKEQIIHLIDSFLANHRPQTSLKLVDIIRSVCHEFGISPQQLTGARRNEKIVQARWFVMHIGICELYLSSTQIGNKLNRDHTTVLYGKQKLDVLLRDKTITKMYQRILTTAKKTSSPPAPIFFDNVSDIQKFYNGYNNHGWWQTQLSPNCTDLSGCFYKYPKFNGDIRHWNVRNVKLFRDMFHDARAFNQDLGAWRPLNGVDFTRMFYKAQMFSSDLSAWHFSKKAYTTDMFHGADRLNTDYFPNCLIF